MWATEVKKVDIESLPKWEEKDLFRCAARLRRLLSGLPCARISKRCPDLVFLTYMGPRLHVIQHTQHLRRKVNVSC